MRLYTYSALISSFKFISELVFLLEWRVSSWTRIDSLHNFCAELNIFKSWIIFLVEMSEMVRWSFCPLHFQDHEPRMQQS